MISSSNNPSYLSGAEARQRLSDMETKYDLYQYKLGGFSAWRLLRFEVMSSLQNLPFSSGEKERSRFRRLMKNVPAAFWELPRLFSPKRARYIIKTFATALREIEMGLYKDVYFDDIIKDLGPWYKIEAINNPAYNDRRKKMLFPADTTTTAIDLAVSALSRLIGPRTITKVAACLAQALQSESNLQYLSASVIKTKLRWFYWSKRIYSMLLKKINPEYVLTADTGEFAIWAAAQELGIIAVEFQHGVFSSDHPDALPGSALRYRDSLIVPDKILLYGKYWMSELQKNKFYDHELIIVGNPRIDRYRQIRSENLSFVRQNRECVIVVTTQGLDRNRLIDFIKQYLSISKNKLDCHVFIKLHPAENDKDYYVNHFSSFSNVEVVSASEDPATFDLLAFSHYHVSIASAVHYDALGIGVPTIVLPLAGYEVVAELISSGHAVLAHTPQDLVNIVSGYKNAIVPTDVSEYYFSPNALQNIRNQLG